MEFDGVKLPVMERFDYKDAFVLVRTDLNLPLDDKGKPDSKFRAVQTLDTLRYLLDAGAKILLATHMERKVDGKKENPNLKFLIPYLANMLNAPDDEILFVDNYLTNEAGNIIRPMKPGQIALYNNLRLHKGEKECDGEFTTTLGRWADYLVEDAFGAFHREHASIVQLPFIFKGKCAIGKLVQKELEAYNAYLKHPKSPMLAIIGGAKIEGDKPGKESDKLRVINALLDNPDCEILLGGLLGFYAARTNFDVNEGPVPSEEVRKAIFAINTETKRVFWPEDFIFHGGTGLQLSPKDIGPKAIKKFIRKIGHARTIFHNGPVSHFEAGFTGTEKILHAIADNQEAVTVIGGGDTINAAEKLGVMSKFNFASTGGGALLNLIANGTLPGIKAVAASI